MVKKLIVGLGNPGEKYGETRHNFGARVVREFLRETGEEILKGRGIAYLLPTVNMNDSGRPVAAFLAQSELTTGDILLVHDELELPLGEYKFQEGGSARGHKGVRAVQELLGTKDIPRLRLGIGRPHFASQDEATRGRPTQEIKDYVLEKFTPEEEKIVEEVIGQAVESIKSYVLPSAEEGSSAS